MKSSDTSIVHVEDCDLDSEMLQFVLRDIAPEVRLQRFKDCSGVKDHVSLACPRMCIIDVDLGTCNGIDLLRSLRQCQSESRIPIVIFSASSNPQDRSKAATFGADDFRVKPTNPDYYVQELKEIFRTWLIQRN